jgi:adenylate kinase
MKIIILGAPGSGKGTYSKGISKALKIPQISSGDLLRNARDDPKFGAIIRENQDSGHPVPDEIVMPIIQKRLSEADCKNGFILDAIPYTINQAIMLEKITSVDMVINLILSDDIIVKKGIGRRLCSKCGTTYNITNINEDGVVMPPLLPKKEGVCDSCNVPLTQRTDDSEATIRERLRVYWKRIEPVMKFYKDKKIVKDIKVDSVPDKMIEKILREIK